jgi:hypothetical protein
MTDDKKTALEQAAIGTSLHCNCGNGGFAAKGADGSEVLQGFRRDGDALICNACGAGHLRSS